MKKAYWVMNKPGSVTEWVEMNGKQFYDFITSPIGKGRYFIDCETYKLEVSLKQYQQWKLETNRQNYLQGFKDEVVILSLESLADNDFIFDYKANGLSVCIEDDVLQKIDLQRLSEAIQSLAYDEQWLINELFLCGTPKTEREVAKETGLSQPAINKQKNKILKKLKYMVIKIEKSQQ